MHMTVFQENFINKNRWPTHSSWYVEPWYVPSHLEANIYSFPE